MAEPIGVGIIAWQQPLQRPGEKCYFAFCDRPAVSTFHVNRLAGGTHAFDLCAHHHAVPERKRPGINGRACGAGALAVITAACLGRAA